MRVKMDVMKIVKKFQHLRSKHGPICLFLRTREATGHTNAMRTTHAGGERPASLRGEQQRCGSVTGHPRRVYHPTIARATTDFVLPLLVWQPRSISSRRRRTGGVISPCSIPYSGRAASICRPVLYSFITLLLLPPSYNQC
jgi:hypothetical protein